VADVTQVAKLLYGEENVVCADAGYTGSRSAKNMLGARSFGKLLLAAPSTYKKHGKRSALYKVIRKFKNTKAQVRAKVEHPFRVIKRQFGYEKVRFRGLVKKTAQMATLFALSNLRMARRHLLSRVGELHP
jgi:IS5 family transposase